MMSTMPEYNEDDRRLLTHEETLSLWKEHKKEMKKPRRYWFART